MQHVCLKQPVDAGPVFCELAELTYCSSSTIDRPDVHLLIDRQLFHQLHTDSQMTHRSLCQAVVRATCQRSWSGQLRRATFWCPVLVNPCMVSDFGYYLDGYWPASVWWGLGRWCYGRCWYCDGNDVPCSQMSSSAKMTDALKSAVAAAATWMHFDIWSNSVGECMRPACACVLLMPLPATDAQWCARMKPLTGLHNKAIGIRIWRFTSS